MKHNDNQIDINAGNSVIITVLMTVTPTLFLIIRYLFDANASKHLVFTYKDKIWYVNFVTMI